MTSVPVAFPTASRPQAWAAGTPLLLLTTLLRLLPDSSYADFEPSNRIGWLGLRRSPIPVA
jgi:glycogen debranching enzyme